MAWPVETAHQLKAFLLFYVFCTITGASNDQRESVKQVLDQQKRALFARPAIRQQSILEASLPYGVVRLRRMTFL